MRLRKKETIREVNTKGMERQEAYLYLRAQRLFKRKPMLKGLVFKNTYRRVGILANPFLTQHLAYSRAGA